MKIRSNFMQALGLAALCFTGAAQAYVISGEVNTSLSDSNQSTDGVTYYNVPSSSPFSLLTVGEFDFSQSSGLSVTGGTLSGDFGSNTLASGTAQVTLFADGIQIANCDVNCEANTQSSDVAWSYTFTAADLFTLSSNTQWLAGQVVITAQQNDASQVVLDPTSVALTAAVPVPGAVWLFGSVLMGWLGFNRRKSI